MRTVLRCVALWMFAAGTLYGQLVTATLQGTAQDSGGAAIPHAKVTVINQSTGVTASGETDASGRFVFASLQPGGPYNVRVEAPGFKTEVRSGISLEVNQTADITIPLQVGSATQEVRVVADASQLETSTPALGQVIPNRSVVNLPLNQRVIYSLMFLMPGVHGSVGDSYNSLNMSVDGGRSGNTEILVDGIPASPPLANPISGISVFPSVDAVQEFKVMATGYSTEFGRSDSGIINVILKSGTNDLHGSVYDFLRNSALDSNTYFSNRNHIALPSFKRNQFGASVAGPVILPRLYNGKNRTFFLFSYEGLRQGTESETTTTVPTALERAGNFSESGVTVYDPSTTTLTATSSGTIYQRQAFENNTIPQNRIDPVAAQIINYFPLPNLPGEVNNYFASGISTLSTDTFDMKVDEVFNDRNRMFVRFSRQNLQQPPVLLFPKALQVAESGDSTPQISTSAAIDYTRNFSPTFVMEIPFGFSRTALNYIANGTGFNPSTQLGFPSYIADNADHLQFPGIAPSNYVTLGNAGQGETRRAGYGEFTVGVNNTKVWGRHLLTFGWQGQLMLANDNESGDSDGNFNFTQALTQGPNANAASTTAGNSIASLLLGLGSGQMEVQSKNGATASKYYGFYIQDDWKATSNLTINLGLRYDLDIPRTERYNRMQSFNANAASPLAQLTGLTGLKGGVQFVGVNNSSRRQYDPQYLNFGPRIGFALQADPLTAFRGSYGIFYGPSLRAAGATIGNEGFSATTTYAGSANGLTPSVYLSDPFPNGINLPVGSSQRLLTGIGTSFESPLTGDNKVGYVQNWDFDIQRQLPFSILIDAAYVGSHGVHLNKSGENDWNTNQLSPAALAFGNQLEQSVSNPFYGIITTGPEASATIPRSYLEAPFPQFTSVYLSYLTGGYEDYNSIQLKLDKRVSKGLTLLVSYTGSKQIDDYSAISNVGNITGGIQNIYNQKGERSVSSNDISRDLVISGVYALPFGRGQQFGSGWSGPVNTVLGGWQINGIVTEENGYPLSPTTQNTSDSGSNILRPNLTGVSPIVHGSIQSKLKGYLNQAAFSQPAPFTFGNAPRTLSNVRAPGYHDVDFSVFKDFAVTGRATAEFRGEAFNLLNQVQFGIPNMVLSSGQFGVISSQANTPREIQAALKILF